MMMAMPKSATADPTMSHVVGRIPLTVHSHKIAIKI